MGAGDISVTNVQVLYLENEGSRSMKKCLIYNYSNEQVGDERKYEEELHVRVEDLICGGGARGLWRVCGDDNS